VRKSLLATPHPFDPYRAGDLRGVDDEEQDVVMAPVQKIGDGFDLAVEGAVNESFVSQAFAKGRPGVLASGDGVIPVLAERQVIDPPGVELGRTNSALSDGPGV
jgi:hypothetical protein